MKHSNAPAFDRKTYDATRNADPDRKAQLRANQLAARQRDPEAWRAMRAAQKARRRQRERAGLDALDRELSRAYRLAIRLDPCGYCGAPGAEDDHVIPLALGGLDVWCNLIRACRPCNLDKHDRPLIEWRPELTKLPRFSELPAARLPAGDFELKRPPTPAERRAPGSGWTTGPAAFA